jgi:large subunit ribosomal protein L28e
MSSDLLWLLSRSNTSFLVKRNGVQLSREPGNLMNTQSLKSSGISSDKPVTIQPAQKGVLITLKKSNAGRKVAKSKVVVELKGNVRQSAKSVENILKHYRPDLVDAALARVSRIAQSQATPKALKVKKVRGRK